MRIDLEQFETMYRSDHDPWSFASSPYEQRKYALTALSLPRSRYERAFEPGSSIGALSEKLAGRVDSLITLEASDTATAAARQRLRSLANVDIRHGTIPENWPEGTFDLIVLSEIGYYWDAQGLTVVAEQVEQTLHPTGHVIGVHWLGRSADHLLDGVTVHQVISTVLGRTIVHHREPEFVLDVWQPG